MVKILVIEDSTGIRETIVDTLQIEGFEVQSCADGYAGVRLAKEHLPDLIVSDITMPGLDGYGVLESLRHDPMTSTIPFIFLTGNSDREDIRRGMELGADDYITKPFKPHELISAVHIRLEKQEAIVKKYSTTLELLRKNITYALPHEFRTPLSLILGFGEVLKIDYAELSPTQVLKIADSIIKAGKRLHRLIENYLAYAQIEMVASDPQQRLAVRNHIIGNPAEIIGAQALEKATLYNRSSDLTLELSNTGLCIARDNLRKIIEELVDNAFKFSKQGTEVHVTALREGEDYLISVTDHGVGMATEQIEQLGAYVQFERALREQQGIGLGFAIANRVVELHDGELMIESILGQGTRVDVRLPIQPKIDSIQIS